MSHSKFLLPQEMLKSEFCPHTHTHTRLYWRLGHRCYSFLLCSIDRTSPHTHTHTYVPRLLITAYSDNERVVRRASDVETRTVHEEPVSGQHPDEHQHDGEGEGEQLGQGEAAAAAEGNPAEKKRNQRVGKPAGPC